MQDTISTSTTGHLSDMEFLTRLNTMLSTNDDYQENTSLPLGLIGKYIRHDRIQIVEVMHDMKISLLYEWHAKELGQTHPDSNSQPILLDKKLEAQLYSQDYISIDETDETISPAIKQQLTKQNGKKMALFPLYESGTQFAFIVYIQCLQKHDWEKEELRLMGTIASIIATHLHKKYLIDKLRHHSYLLKKSEHKITHLESELNTLNGKLQPTWQQLKTTFKDLSQETPSQVDLFDQHLYVLNQICQNIPLK